MTRPSVDQKSHDLAEDFLADEPTHTEDDVRKLASDIQHAAEDFLTKFDKPDDTPRCNYCGLNSPNVEKCPMIYCPYRTRDIHG